VRLGQQSQVGLGPFVAHSPSLHPAAVCPRGWAPRAHWRYPIAPPAPTRSRIPYDPILSGSIQAYGRILCIVTHKKLPRAKIIPGTTHHVALMHHRKRRYPPLPKSDRRALGGRDLTDTRLYEGPQETLAVSHADQSALSWIVASIVSVG
jgi:hypothetical protein